MRLRFGKPPQLEHPLFFCPVWRPGDSELLAGYLAQGPFAVEIGVGKGGFLAATAKARPDWRLVGFEVRTKYCRLALEKLDRTGAQNARIVLGDARLLIPSLFPKRSIHSLFVLFPDPWWKTRHHRRRVLDETFFLAMRPLLADKAWVVVRSDVPLVLDLAAAAMRPDVGFVQLESAPLELPETDRQKACRARSIPVDERCFQFVLPEDAHEN